MESPPSFSAHSEAPLLSEDSGLIVTSGSVSSDSVSGWLPITSELQESDYDEKSLSLYDSQDASERMCADNFNTVKKGPAKILIPAIDPPPQFQDSPTSSKHSNSSDDQKCQILEKGDSRVPKLSMSMLGDAAIVCHKMCCDKQHCMKRYASPRLIHLSPCHVTVRPVSRSSLTSRLSSSHNSLTTQPQTDDSSFITQAISHDTLSVTASDIADMYNVPFDSDIYAVPIDTVRPSRSARLRNKRLQRDYRNRGKSICQSITSPSPDKRPPKFSRANSKTCESTHEDETKRHSIPGTSSNEHSLPAVTEPMHMTLQEVRKYLHALYSSSSESESKTNLHTLKSGKTKTKTSNSSNNINNNNNVRYNFPEGESDAVSKNNIESDNNLRKNKKNSFSISVKNMKKSKDVIQLKEINEEIKAEPTIKPTRSKKSPVKNLKQTLCNFFKLRRVRSAEGSESEEQSRGQGSSAGRGVVGARRALPPLPPSDISTPARLAATDTPIDFTTSIQKVKDYGWYWGPLSVEAAERILSDEPDGSFIVRDSSDDHYIFTLTFKLNGMRHVRIEHDQGNFCFGSCTMFKAHTIVEFIENAVETSRSGRYLFFLNLRPVLGPMRVQLLYPVSRFKRVQSLQHMCRFVILKVVRRDLISNLPLPRRLLDYLSTPHYYSETLMDS